MAKFDLKKIGEVAKKYAVPLIMGGVAVVSAVLDQKKEEKFNALEQAVSELKNKQ